jgi:hypothetical protein
MRSICTITAPVQAVAFRTQNFDRVQPDLQEVYRALGLRPQRLQHRPSLELVAELAGVVPRLARPRGMFRIDDVRQLAPRRLELSSNAVFEGALGRFLAHSRLVATFIVTIGSAAERLGRRWLRGGQIMKGAVLDALASELVEATAQACQDEVRAWARQRGLDVTPRYSPGYCGLRLAQQAAVFASLPARRINVHLTPSCLMLPIKSVSGLIGIGPAERVSPSDYPCQWCDHPDCMQRRGPRMERHGGCRDWAESDVIPESAKP